MRRARSFLLAGLITLALAIPVQAQTLALPEDAEFREEITVALSTVTVRVVDWLGQPIPDLAPEDFRVRIGKREIPVAAVDWLPAGAPAPLALSALPSPGGSAQPAAEPGQLVVFFVQADLNPTCISGQR